MANLYELMDGYDAIQEAFEDDDMTMERLEELLDALEEGKDELRVKVDNICRLLRNIGGNVTKFRDEEKRLAARRRAMENKVERVRDWLKSTMDLVDVTNIRTNVFHVQIVEQGERIVVLDEGKVPDEFMRVKKSPDMRKINKAYKEEGEIVQGCDTVVQKALVIR